MDTGIRHQAGLEFCQIDIQGLIKHEGSSDKGHNLASKATVTVDWAFNIEVCMTDVLDGLVSHESTIRVYWVGSLLEL